MFLLPSQRRKIPRFDVASRYCMHDIPRSLLIIRILRPQTFPKSIWRSYLAHPDVLSTALLAPPRALIHEVQHLQTLLDRASEECNLFKP